MWDDAPDNAATLVVSAPTPGALYSSFATSETVKAWLRPLVWLGIDIVGRSNYSNFNFDKITAKR